MWGYDVAWVVGPMARAINAEYERAHALDPEKPLPATDDGYSDWGARTIYRIVAQGLTPEQSLQQTILELDQALGLVRPLPPAPSRDALGAVRIGFQGVTASTQQYGDFPMFGPETTTLDDADLTAYCQQIRAAGFTHGEIAVSWAYREPGFLMPVPGRDLSNDLPELCRRIRLMLTAGGLTGVVLFMAGDGRSRPKNPDGTYPYNDPVGDTYGYEWLMEHTSRIWSAVMAAGLHRHTIPCPGYDSVWYGWGGDTDGVDRQPARMKAWFDLLRAVDPGALIAVEHGAGKMVFGQGQADFEPGGTGENVDVVLGEYPADVHGDQVWQIVGRLIRPYSRPADQPAGDDPNPPFVLVDSPRGRRVYVRYEYRTFDWTRGRVTAAQVQADRAYLQALGPGPVC